MKKIAFALLLAILLPYSVKADMVTGGTFLQFTTGLNSYIAPSFAMRPTIGVRMWSQISSIKFAVEGTAFSNQLTIDDSTKTGWSAAGYVKVRTFTLGKEGALHLLAKGGISTQQGSWSMILDESQYDVGPVLDYQHSARAAKPSGWGAELGVYWMAANNLLDHVGVQTRVVVDFD